MEPPRADVRPRPSVLDAWIDGWRRVFRAPIVIAGMVAAVAIATELRVVPGSIFDQLSWIAGNDAFGFGGPIGLLGRLLASDQLRQIALDRLTAYAVAGPDVVVFMFLAGGAIDRLARDRRVGTAAFFAACGTGFLRFLRLGVVLGGASWLLLRVTLPFPIAVLALLFALGRVGDYAQLRMIVEDRRSAIAAIGASLRFIVRHPLQVLVLFALNLTVVTAVMLLINGALSTWMTGTASRIAIWALLLAAALVRVVARLGFMGASIALFQNELAHRGYTATPIPTWPDSPSVEAVANMEARQRGHADRALPL